MTTEHQNIPKPPESQKPWSESQAAALLRFFLLMAAASSYPVATFVMLCVAKEVVNHILQRGDKEAAKFITEISFLAILYVMTKWPSYSARLAGSALKQLRK